MYVMEMNTKDEILLGLTCSWVFPLHVRQGGMQGLQGTATLLEMAGISAMLEEMQGMRSQT